MNQTLPYDWKMDLRDDAALLSEEHELLGISLAGEAWDAYKDGNQFAYNVLIQQAYLHTRTANMLDQLLDEYVKANA